MTYSTDEQRRIPTAMNAARWPRPCRTAALALGVLVLMGAPGCAPKKKVYTVPKVTDEIEGTIRQARKLKARGKLKQASKKLLSLADAVLKEYPRATLTQEPVEKLVNTLEWIANLSLDRSLELKNESVSAAQDELSERFRAWSEKHRENMAALRKLLPSLKKATVEARRPPPRPGAKARPAPDSAAPGSRPAGDEPTQPRPDEPRLPSDEPGAEPS